MESSVKGRWSQEETQLGHAPALPAIASLPMDLAQLHVAALGFPAQGAAGSSRDGPHSQDGECR